MIIKREYIKVVKTLCVFAFLLLSACKEKLPELFIYTSSEIGSENKDTCQFVLQQDGEKTIRCNAVVKYRGGSSASFPKKSLSIELAEKHEIGGVEKDDDWILNASYIDKTFMRHKVGSDLFMLMHENNKAAHSTYVLLHINSVPQGLYLAMEEINASNLELNKADSMAMLFKDPPIFYKEKIPFPQDSTNYYQQKYPKITALDQTAYLEKFKMFLFESSDDEFNSNIHNWVDVDNVIHWHLWLLLTNNSDGLLKNFYMYKVNESTPFRFAVWDVDHSFGRDGDNELNMLEREIDCNRSILLKRLGEMNSYQTALASTWQEMRTKEIISYTSFLDMIRKNEKSITAYISQNQSFWPINASWYFDDNTFDEEVLIMHTYFKMRLKQLDHQFNYE